MRSLIATAALALLVAVPAHARDPDGRYANAPYREWYQTRELTEAAQKRLPYKSCCSHADVVKTRFRPTVTGGDGWEFIDGRGLWVRVPDDIIHWGEDTPTGEPVMFAIGGTPVCFFPGKGGI